jgi:hypothetical protein
MHTSPRFSAADVLLVLLCLASASFLGLEFWSGWREFGPGLLLFVSPVLVGGLLLLWSYRAEVRRRLGAFLAGLCAGALFFGLASAPQAAGWWELPVRGTAQLGAVAHWLLLLCTYVLAPIFSWALAGWCYRRLCRVFATLDNRTA